jgi:cyclic beta-1,2-glucan synthetase
MQALSEQKPRPISSMVRLAEMPAWFAEALGPLEAVDGPAAKAAEWLLDNDYLIERAIRQIRQDLPSGYFAHLPALALDGDTRLPRVYAVAHSLVRASSLQLSAATVARFVNGYQEVTPLRIAELWALPTMLRLTCIEVLVAALLRLVPGLAAPFQVGAGEPSQLMLEDTECVARAIRALDTISSISWGELVRETSVVEGVLREDPSGTHPQMNFETRDRYRSAVEELARGSHHDEVDVARRAIAHARRSVRVGGRQAHVGYWLIDRGRPAFERSLGYRPRWGQRWRRSVVRHATSFYLLALASLTAGFAAVPGLYLSLAGAPPTTWIIGVLLALLPASMLGVTVLHWRIARLLPPNVLPKLELPRGIPAEYKTAVVIPTLLGSAGEIDQLLRQIERHYIGNSDPNLQFALLTDFSDALSRETSADATLVQRAISGVQRLNRLHGSNGVGPFHLLHRERRYNEAEGCWMGWERKRGKLEEFNRILAGESETSFIVREGSPEGLRRIRFVITLDTDTMLPQGTARRLVGALAHPLNRAEFDPESGRVRAGYTLIQPRIETSPEGGNRSLFSRLYCGDTAIDIYSRAVSDVFQDLFGTGIYVGKGIYDVEAFSRSLVDRVPENRLASHDLFEGIHGRAALATDIILYEEYPAHYLAFARRMHRWIRGDWQLLPWLERRVPSARRDYLPNRFATIDRWKIIDNLRRSLLPPALLLLLASGWVWLPGSPAVWTLLALLAPTGHLFIDFASGLVRERHRPLRRSRRALRENAGRWLLLLVFLPHEAFVTADAILRTLVRLAVTRRHLLQWTTAAHTTALIMRTHPRLLAWREMFAAPLLALLIGAATAYWRPTALPFAMPFLGLWFFSPEIAHRISRPYRPHAERLSGEDIDFLRGLARRTWLFFETFVSPDDHWLPPDNYQEDPRGEIAHRTSPTNIGMMFLSTLAAFDLGYLSPTGLSLRLRSSLETLARLQRYRGHLLNWYDTQTLEPLLPRYVSTVDSGNLAGALLTLRAGCADVLASPALRSARWQGLLDTIGVLENSLEHLTPEKGDDDIEALRARTVAIRDAASDAQSAPETWLRVASELLERDCHELDRLVLELVTSKRGSMDLPALREVRIWLARVHDHLRSMQREAEMLLPWLPVLASAPLDEDGRTRPILAELAESLADMLPPSLRLVAIAERCSRARKLLVDVRDGLSRAVSDAESEGTVTAAAWLDELEQALVIGERNVAELQNQLDQIGVQAETEALRMDFRLLYDSENRQLHIGYNLSADRIDPHHYDLLASEARLASFLAIAKGDVPVEHWFALGRPVTRAGNATSLLSWGGSMFEYLMPPLLMRSYDGTLLAQSQRAALETQIEAAQRQRVPWGVSESGYASMDADRNYQYRAFGVHGLGLKRGLEEDLVIAPYATLLALTFRPAAAVENLVRLRELGMMGSYGLYEAIDFTPNRVAEGESCSIVRSYMSHHQGMILAALDNQLCDETMVRRFQANPRVHASELLLHEQVPVDSPVEVPHAREAERHPKRKEEVAALYSWRPVLGGAYPETHALGNGRLSTLITDAGSGTITWQEHSITRWLPDSTLDNSGLWIYVRDEESGLLWSVGRQPTGVSGNDMDVVFHPHAAEFHRRDHGIALRAEVAVAPADDVEVRRISVVNETGRERSLSFTSCAEVVLTAPAEDARHPAFSKLFVEGQHLADLNALLFTRRARDPDKHPPVLVHRLVSDAASVHCAGFEMDRERFLGRMGRPHAPRAFESGLSGSTGSTLDTVMALQARVELPPYATRQLAFVTVAGGSRQSVLETAARYDTVASIDWLLADAQADVAREVGRLGLDPERLPELQKLLSLLLNSHSALRCSPERIARNSLGQPQLWGMGISGDAPVLLMRSANPQETELLADLVRAHSLWRRRGIGVDLVVLSQASSGYEDDALDEFHMIVRGLGASEWLGRHEGIHFLRADQIPREELRLLEVAARAILDADRPLATQLAELHGEPQHLPRFAPTQSVPEREPAAPLDRPRDLQFDNSFGGFTADGREYVIHLEPGESTPAPWCNVLANSEFGCVVTEIGGGYTWAANSGEFRLTPWTNDPVADSPGESLYLRDEETAQVWTPTPSPAGLGATCQIRHGAGYTEWRQNSHGLEQRLRVFVPTDAPVKLVRLSLLNAESRPRRFTATYYAEWVLGTTAATARPFVVSDYDPAALALLARNSWSPEFADRVAFLASDREPHGFTTDRTEFLGREGDARSPAALARWGLSGKVGAGLDPCAALQVHLDIGPGEEVETLFVLGAGRSAEHAQELLRTWRDPGREATAWRDLEMHWNELLGVLTVATPEPAMDLMLNRWLLYQAISSRILGRTGFYQSSGAFGFRDQLQDILAVLHTDPAMARTHILACAERQFEEGDVLHWWHPPGRRGVRTRCTDDLLWLPFAAARYVEATGDRSILDAEIPFLSAPELEPGEHDRYGRYELGSERGSLFEHCQRALERGLTRGPSGLPLIGDGDWNDGLNRVGAEGRGESIWLAWFGFATLEAFAELCDDRGESERAHAWRHRARELAEVTELEGWDGAWYRRAFDDEGRAWGSTDSEECRIDSVAQSWAVISGAARPDRARQALQSAESQLLLPEDKLVRLLWPPFDTTPRDPGYIKAYPPGVRENAGQYAHAAAWFGWAFAKSGDGERAARIFSFLNPIVRAATREEAMRYRLEPYVVAADIASVEPHVGRGGWSWYTGTAAWAWRLGVEAILGLCRVGGSLRIDPCIPPNWRGFAATLRDPGGILEIVVEDPSGAGRGVAELTLDGAPLDGDQVPLPSDGKAHELRVRLGAKPSAP